VDEFVEVIDVTVYVAVPGKDGEPASFRYTVRPIDVITYGPLSIQFAPKEVKVGGETRLLPGKRVRFTPEHVVNVEHEVRLEPKVRPSAASLINRDAAELDVLKQKHGIR
jgi:hypothetical protein